MKEIIKRGEWEWEKGQYPNGFFLQSANTEKEQDEIIDYLNTLPDRENVRHHINAEIYKAFEKIGAKSDLLSIIGSYGDTMSDADILDALKSFNQ